MAMMSFLEGNGICLACDENELIALGMGLADGSMEEDTVLQFIIEHSL